MQERSEVRSRVFGTLLKNALLRWETAATFVITMVLFFAVGDISVPILGALPPWIWLILGGAAEAVLVASAITDPEEMAEAMAREFEEQYDLNEIRNRNAREKLRAAMEYRRNMLNLVKQRQGAMRLSLRQTVEEINDWIGHMYNLARQIDNFEANTTVERDLAAVPTKIEKVKIRLAKVETDERVRADLEAQLETLEKQRKTLEATKNSVKRAEIQLESTLAALGTIYAQMSQIGAKDVDSGRAQRLQLEIRDEVGRLQDTIDTMDEMAQQSLRLS